MNTVVQQHLRNLKKIEKFSIEAAPGACSCGSPTCDFRTTEKMNEMFNKAPWFPPTVDEICNTGGAFVVHLTLDRERLYLLDVAGFSHTKYPLNYALTDLFRRTITEAVRKNDREAYLRIKNELKRSEWKKIAEEEYKRIEDAFAQATCYLVRPDPNPLHGAHIATDPDSLSVLFYKVLFE